MSVPSTGLGDIDRLVVSPRRAQGLLDCGHSHLYELLAAGELESFLSGRSRKITVASILAYIARKISAAGVAVDVTRLESPHPARSSAEKEARIASAAKPPKVGPVKQRRCRVRPPAPA